MASNFITRAYNKISKDKDTILKESTNDKLDNEINFFKNIPSSLKKYFPEYISSQKKDNIYYLKLQYIESKDLGYFITEQKDIDWVYIIKHLVGAVEHFKETTIETNLILEDKTSMLIDKTYNEFKNFSSRDHSQHVTKPTTINSNGIELRNFEQIWPDIKLKIEELKTTNHSFIHGDLCFANILLSDNKDIYFVDPRGSYGSTKYCYGDYRYDYAKLLHSIDGSYEFIIRDKFNLNDLDYQIQNYKNKRDLLKEFKSSISEDDYKAALLIQGLIFIGMCDRHYDSHERQTVMYLTGLKILNELL